MTERITPYKRGHYPSIEGNDRVFFEEEFRKLEQTIGQIVSALDSDSKDYTIASGVITLSKTAHLVSLITVDTESSAATDDLDTITSTQAGKIIVVQAADAARTVVLKDATDNLVLSGDCTLDNSEDTIVLMKVGDNWVEIARSNNGA